MKISILTVFPEMFDLLNTSIIGRAIKNGLLTVDTVNIRDYSTDKHSKTDDTPFGGGAGMVMLAQPIVSAIRATDSARVTKRIYLSPKGQLLTQKKVVELSKCENLLLLCGSFEGVDQRAIDLEIDEEISIGDYVLTSGELPALVLINAIARNISGVLHSQQSLEEESFSSNLLEYPHYTRPAEFEGLKVPSVLLSGNHQEIDKWRKEKSLELTSQRRPDLLSKNNEHSD